MLVTSLTLALPLLTPGHDGSDDGLQVALAERERVYRVRQTTRLQELPDDAGQVRWWVSIPDDDRFQDVLDLEVVSAPGAWRIERDRDRANRFLLIEVDRPAGDALEAVVEFTLKREPVLVQVDAGTVGPIEPSHLELFAEETRLDERHMEVTDRILDLAHEICGEETNPALQVRALLDFVADAADHYSKDPSKPSCGVGDADDCLVNGGGCCTDLHSLFIALARARAIPARLQMGYRLLARNEGAEVDPGYRCWAEYFLPGHGWIPADLVEADADDGLGRERWFSGLTERRLWLNQGRDFRFPSARADEPATTMSLGYAEVDGRPVRVRPEGDLPSQLSRSVRFEELAR